MSEFSHQKTPAIKDGAEGDNNGRPRPNDFEKLSYSD